MGIWAVFQANQREADTVCGQAVTFSRRKARSRWANLVWGREHLKGEKTDHKQFLGVGLGMQDAHCHRTSY